MSSKFEKLRNEIVQSFTSIDCSSKTAAKDIKVALAKFTSQLKEIKTKKGSSKTPKKPNCFIMFGKSLKEAGEKLTRQEISVKWKAMSEEEKNKFKDPSDEEKKVEKKDSFKNSWFKFLHVEKSTDNYNGMADKERKSAISEKWKNMSKEEKDRYEPNSVVSPPVSPKAKTTNKSKKSSTKETSTKKSSKKEVLKKPKNKKIDSIDIVNKSIEDMEN
jgi:hypothetical protein